VTGDSLIHSARLWCASANHCNTLQPTATHCNPLQPTATHCNPLQPTAPQVMGDLFGVEIVTQCNSFRHTATHCNTLQHTATHCNAGDGGYDSRDNSAALQHIGLQLVGTHRNTLQHTATHCNTLQYTATQVMGDAFGAAIVQHCCYESSYECTGSSSPAAV